MFEVEFSDQIFRNLRDKVIIITGASSGIGLAATKFFTGHGSHVVAVDLNPLPETIVNTHFRRVDLTKWNEQYDLFQWTKNTFGRIDVAFLNAGVPEIENVFADTLDEQGRLKEPEYKVLDINLISVINGTKLAIHFMRKQKEPGSIVITGSGKCFNGIGGTPMYAVSKHGLLGLLRTLKADIPAEFNIRVNMVCPFWTDTGILSPEMRQNCPSAQQCMQPADVPAKAAAYLSIDEKANGMAIYAACGKYTDMEPGFQLSRSIWLGPKNHLDRILFEEDPLMSSSKTKFD